MSRIEEPEFDLYQLVIVHLDGVQHVTEILRRCYDIDEAQWFYSVRGLDGLYPAEIIDFKEHRSDAPTIENPARIEHERENLLLIGQRIRVHTLTVDGSIRDQDATVRAYQDGKMLVRFDDQGYAAPLPPSWTFDLLPDKPVSHWQVWQVAEDNEQLLKDNCETPLAAEYFAKQQEQESHRVASRHDDWIPPPRFEVRAVPIEEDRE